MFTALAVLASLILLLFLWFRKDDASALDHIPGPSPRSFWHALLGLRDKNSKAPDPYKRHMLLASLKEKYGGIFKLQNGPFTSVVISDYDMIYEVLVKSGTDFGGRLTSYQLRNSMGGTGILLSYSPDKVWTTLRKISQRHLRQFGDGLSRLEAIIGDVAEDMFDTFQKNDGKPSDPSSIVFDTALNSIVYLITGERTYIGDAIVEEMREYEDLFLKTIPPGVPPVWFNLLNIFPWLKYLGFDKWEPFQRFCNLHNQVWETVKEMNRSNPGSESICKVLQAHLSTCDDQLSEDDARSTALSLLFAGVTTTSATFHAAVNILAHNLEIQEKIHLEVEKTAEKTGELPKLSDRADMPYTRAFLYELLRYTSVVATGVQHRALRDTTLKGHKIPANTLIQISIWNLHHDEAFWGDPFAFRPERFLDESGEVIAADHPRRTHLLPFGAGTRVCLGESLALARLFMWTSALVARFVVTPAPGNVESSTDARSFSFTGVLKSPEYKVIFTKRN